MGCVPSPAASPGLPSGSAGTSGGAGAIPPGRWPVWAGVLLAPSAAALRRWALAGVVISALIILTGAAVQAEPVGPRLPGLAGLHAHSVAAAGATGDSLIHRWIEFGNRLVTVAIFVSRSGCSSQPGASGRRRRSPPRSALAGRGAARRDRAAGGTRRPGRVTKLNPALVSLHFLSSVALIAAAVGALYARCQEGTAPGRAARAPAGAAGARSA